MVTVHDVQPGQTITVTVSLNYDTGTLDVESRHGGDGLHEYKVWLCHLEGNGSYHLIEVDDSATDDHMAHGDVDPVDLRFDDDNCGLVEIEIEIGDEIEEPEDGNEKVELCHLTSNGEHHAIEVSVDALPDHLAHGDGYANDPVPGGEGLMFDADCAIVAPQGSWTVV